MSTNVVSVANHGQSQANSTETRPEETELSVLVAHELASRSAAAELICKAAHLARPDSPPTVRREHPFDGRPADIMISSNGSVVLIENKMADGKFEEGQAEHYRELRRKGHCSSTVLIAPKSFLRAHKKQVEDCFTGSVSIEDLVDALKRGAPKGAAAEAELDASYSYRADRFTQCVTSKEASTVDPTKATFVRQYQELASKLDIREVQVSPGSTDPKKNTTSISFVPWVEHGGNAEYRAYHELYGGYVWLRVPGYSLIGLRVLLDKAKADLPLPQGWAPGQGSGKHPGLFFNKVDKLTDPLDFERDKSVVEKALKALASLRCWWDKGGDRLLQDSSTRQSAL